MHAPELRHDGVDPRETGVGVGPLGQRLVVSVPGNLKLRVLA
jgi:hypothetical protein